MTTGDSQSVQTTNTVCPIKSQLIHFSKVSPLFLTHFHSDHTVGIPDLWLTGWLGGAFGRRTTQFTLSARPGPRS